MSHAKQKKTARFYLDLEQVSLIGKIQDIQVNSVYIVSGKMQGVLY